MKTFYRRHLPHYQPPNATYSVTFRLAGSLPPAAIERIRHERAYTLQRIATIRDKKRQAQEYRDHQIASFNRFEDLLDDNRLGPQWLLDAHIAKIVADAIHHFFALPNEVICYCIMPNHVHLISRPHDPGSQAPDSITPDFGVEPFALTRILRRVKGLTARQGNLVLERRGAFWQHESYDHVIREGAELERTLWYVLTNPVKARLVDEWEEWPWSYCNQSLL